VELKGEVTEEEWRKADRRRAYLIYMLAAIIAVVVTAVLYVA
jgi:hypothetical protein